MEQPNYAPNTVNQTVDWKGNRFKGNPGQGWQFVGVSGQQGFDNAPPSVDPIEQAKKIRQFNIESNQPYVQTLEASKTPLNQKYNDLITEITRKEGVESTQQNTALSREYGKRGIPLSSGAFSQDLTEKQRPISEFYTGQKSQATTAAAQGEADINNLIGQLQSGDPASSIQAALQLTELSQQGYQNQIQNALALRQFNEISLPQSQAQIANYNKEDDPFSRYVTVDEGQSIFDLLGGGELFSKGKTYKGTDGDGRDF